MRSYNFKVYNLYGGHRLKVHGTYPQFVGACERGRPGLVIPWSRKTAAEALRFARKMGVKQ